MKFNPYTNRLVTDDNLLINVIGCPKNATRDEMKPLVVGTRLCEHCEKNVIDIKDLSDEEVLEIVKNDKNACFKFDLNYENIEVVDNYRFSSPNPMNLRVIKTARDEESINNAVEEGYKPLIKKLKQSSEIRSKYAVFQSKKSGKIFVSSDYRNMGRLRDKDEEFVVLIDYDWYYPHSFPSPFAAYLVPKDIRIDEVVFIEDLIEDLVGSTWKQGDIRRLNSSEAIWNGHDFEIVYNDDQVVERIG